MSYLRVPNWEKHQHRDLASKGNMPWFKMETGIFDDPEIAELTAPQFRAYVLLLTLAARTGNRLPASKTWLRAHFGTNWNRNLRELSKHGLVEGSIPSQKAPQNATTDRADDAPTPRLEEKRGEKTTTRDRSLEALDDARAPVSDTEGVEGKDQAAAGDDVLEPAAKSGHDGLGASGNVFAPGGVLGRVAVQAAAGAARVVSLEDARARRELLEEVSVDFGAFVAEEGDSNG